MLAGAVIAGLLVLADTGAYPRLGVSVPSAAAQVSVAGLRAVAELAAGLAVGSLLFAGFVVAPQRSGTLDVAGWLAMRRAGAGAAVAGVAALLLGPLTAADLSGVALGAVVDPARFDLYAVLEEPMAWLITGSALLACAAGCAVALAWRWVPVLLAVGVASLLPPAVVGPAATGAGHDWTTDASLLQAVGGTAFGVVVSLLAYRRHGTADESGIAEQRCRGLVVTLGTVLLASTAVLTVLRVGSGPVLASPNTVSCTIPPAVPGPLDHPHVIPSIAILISRCDSSAIRSPSTAVPEDSAENRTREYSPVTAKTAVKASPSIGDGNMQASST